MNPLERINLILLVVQYYDLQNQIIAMRASATEGQVILRIFGAVLDMARVVLSFLKEYKVQRNSPVVWKKVSVAT